MMKEVLVEQRSWWRLCLNVVVGSGCHGLLVRRRRQLSSV